MRTLLIALVGALLCLCPLARPLAAATISVPAGGNLQSALNSAVGGDTIVLEANATYTGNFVLPVHAGSGFVTIRTSTSDSLLPLAGTRITPAAAALMPKLRSGNSSPALRTAAAAAYWRVTFVEFLPNLNGAGDIIQLGDGSSTQNYLGAVPQQLVLDAVYVHGDPLLGQKRGVALNSGDTTIVNSYISDIKSISVDTQAIGGWNGPGPYHVENNYLEAAGEVFMLGGDDPKIANQVPSDVLLRGNTLTRPLAWRDPILLPPGRVSGNATAGALPAGTYGYRIVARRPADSGSMATSLAAPEVTVTVADAGGVSLQWDAVPNATEYRVYGRTPGAADRYWTIAAPATTFADTGSAGTAGTVQSKATVWIVKNLFELKNARRVQADHNVLEHNWAQAQSGIAVVLTPRNQGGTCAWCVVEDVTFEFNRVRGVGAGASILGWDNLHPSQQANNIRIRNNEFSGVSKSWGGNGYFLSIMDNPRDITVDHNTIISPDGSGVINASGAATTGFVFTNNVARHNLYGIIGSGYGIGNSSIAQYFPGSLITRNVLAGGNASLYPAGNLFPTTTDFEAQFVNYAGGDYSLDAGSSWRNAGTDGADLGSGLYAEVSPPIVAVMTTTLAPATVAQPYDAQLSASGGAAPYQWSITSGALPPGLALDSDTGWIQGTPTAAGTSAFTARVTDTAGAFAESALTIDVTGAANSAPVAISATLQATE